MNPLYVLMLAVPAVIGADGVGRFDASQPGDRVTLVMPASSELMTLRACERAADALPAEQRDRAVCAAAARSGAERDR